MAGDDLIDQLGRLATVDPQIRGLAGLGRQSLQMLSDPRFRMPALVSGLVQVRMVAFITGSPWVFLTLRGASARTHGWLVALIACALIVSARINGMALRRLTPDRLLGAALALDLAAGLVTVASVATGAAGRARAV